MLIQCSSGINLTLGGAGLVNLSFFCMEALNSTFTIIFIIEEILRKGKNVLCIILFYVFELAPNI